MKLTLRRYSTVCTTSPAEAKSTLIILNLFAGKLTLVQVSSMNGQVNIFDVQTTPALMVMGGLKKLLESNIVKVSPVNKI